MNTPLHEVDTLVSLADTEPGPVRDWATARIAVRAPERYRHAPSGDLVHDVIVAARPPALVSSFIDALAEPPSSGLAQAIAMLGRYGALPADPAALIEALAAAQVGDGREADLWLAWALAELGDISTEAVRHAAAAESGDQSWVLPAILVRHAHQRDGLTDLLPQLAAGLAPKRGEDPGTLAAVLGALGAPVDLPLTRSRDPREVAERAARRAGGDLPAITVPKGSRRRRALAWVQALAEGSSHPASHLLAATASKATDLDSWWNWAVTVATWLRVYEPGDPITDVLEHHAGVRPDVLTAARDAVGPSHAPAVAEALETRSDLGVALLALDLLPEHPTLGDPLIGAIGANTSLSHQVVTAAAAWHAQALVPGFLATDRLLHVGLTLAEWCPTEPVLEALLGLPEQSDPLLRTTQAAALAAMGDRAVLPRLAPMLAEDTTGALQSIRDLVEALFGPIDR